VQFPQNGNSRRRLVRKSQAFGLKEEIFFRLFSFLLLSLCITTNIIPYFPLICKAEKWEMLYKKYWKTIFSLNTIDKSTRK